MSKRKDCYGTSPDDGFDVPRRTYTCRTSDCPYVEGCVKEMGKRKMQLQVMRSYHPRKLRIIKGDVPRREKTLASKALSS